VLEITERTAIKDYPRFQEYLKAFRERGFRFAVDDAGSGYAGLGSIANLAPDYIKLDISLIANIDTNFLKQNLVETMVTFANNQGAQVIAEGVERREEFETVKQLGVHFTQGFLFHRPRYAGLPADASQQAIRLARVAPAQRRPPPMPRTISARDGVTRAAAGSSRSHSSVRGRAERPRPAGRAAARAR
jgi:EAL domain-containing protein (putative c-di-GMP-specific phosphodiesterase class I)